jgi:hypothetical protein
MMVEQSECSETLAFKLQTLANHPEESKRQSENDGKFEIKNVESFEVSLNEALFEHIKKVRYTSFSAAEPRH